MVKKRVLNFKKMTFEYLNVQGVDGLLRYHYQLSYNSVSE